MSKTVVVTGSSSGFGHMVSVQLAREGYRVYATMRDSAGNNADVRRELLALAAAEDLDLRVLDMDVSSTRSVDTAATTVMTESGAPNAVINNAGQMYMGLTEAFSSEEFTRQLDINVVGVHRVNRAFLPEMREQGNGVIINVSSVAGRTALPFFGLYHASKWALEGYTVALRTELASSGVDMVLIEPGPVATELFAQTPIPEDSDGRAGTYPPVALQTFEQMSDAFLKVLKNPKMPNDPELVVNRMIELIKMEPGTRPLRSVVGVHFGIERLNDLAEEHDASLKESMGLTAFARLAPRKPH
ncbi:MAG: SDR family oxidoreductase [Gammaproteobacteria bacterium]|nr:SDR family oxidoreductase [Gammaproteobacteria bacterium]